MPAFFNVQVLTLPKSLHDSGCLKLSHRMLLGLAGTNSKTCIIAATNGSAVMSCTGDHQYGQVSLAVSHTRPITAGLVLSRPCSGMQVVGLQATDFALLFWLEVDQPKLSRSNKDAISQVPCQLAIAAGLHSQCP